MFRSWIITIILGSILSPLLITLAVGNFNGMPNLFSVIVVSIVASFLFSIPAILVFWSMIANLEHSRLDQKTKNQRLFLVHILCGLITFLLISAIFGVYHMSIIIYGATYTGIGMLLWYREIEKNKKTELE